MDFRLMLNPQQTQLQLAAQRSALLATNGEAYTMYGLQLSADDAEMILQVGRQAMESEELIEFGGSITPHIVHWFLQAGYFHGNYAAQIAELTTVFYSLKGKLQKICEDAHDPACMLSDNAILNYMYRLYLSPPSAGDIDVMADQADRLLCGGMQRLLTHRAEKRSAAQSGSSTGDDAMRALYADVLQDELSVSDWETRSEEEAYDYTYRDLMYTDCFGNYENDYDSEIGAHIRGTYAEELEEVLWQNPEMLLPSEAQEREWDSIAERWDEEDAANGKEL